MKKHITLGNLVSLIFIILIIGTVFKINPIYNKISEPFAYKLAEFGESVWMGG